MVHQSFDDLMNNHAFIGYSFDVALSTAVVGSEKHGSFIKGILDMYDSGNFITENTFFKRNHGENPYHDNKWQPNNEFITWYALMNCRGLSLNNREQVFSNVHIYPSNYFELGDVFGKYYSRHLSYNSWKTKHESLIRKIKRKAEENVTCWILLRRILYKKRQKNTSFYRCRNAIQEAYKLEKIR